MTDLPEILSALSRLNVHARAWGCGKKAIYAYKTFAAAEFATEARPVFVPVKCHHCNGTGIYRDWDGYERGPCYRCTKGIVTLRFVESTIGDFRWHHPTGNGGGNNVLNAVWGINRSSTRKLAALIPTASPNSPTAPNDPSSSLPPTTGGRTCPAPRNSRPMRHAGC